MQRPHGAAALNVEGRREWPLPRELPIFPISGALLLPGSRLPLQVFEPRYLALTEDVLGSGRMFGMIQPNTVAATEETEPTLYQVGCLGRIVTFSETEDGRYLITLAGIVRFRILTELAMRRGYRVVAPDYAPYWSDVDPPAMPLAIDRAGLLAALRAYFVQQGYEVDWEAVTAMSDEALVTTLSAACPFEPAEKQALLEAGGHGERAASLLALLRMAAHRAPGGRSNGGAEGGRPS